VSWLLGIIARFHRGVISEGAYMKLGISLIQLVHLILSWSSPQVLFPLSVVGKPGWAYIDYKGNRL